MLRTNLKIFISYIEKGEIDNAKNILRDQTHDFNEFESNLANFILGSILHLRESISHYGIKTLTNLNKNTPAAGQQKIIDYLINIIIRHCDVQVIEKALSLLENYSSPQIKLAEYILDNFKGLKHRHIDSSDRRTIQIYKHNKLPLVSGCLGELPDTYFIIDTGSSSSVLSRKYCDDNSISYYKELSTTSLDGSGKNIEVFHTQIKLLKFKGLYVSNHLFGVIQLNEKLRVAGIVAPQDIFGESAFEIDFTKDAIKSYPDLNEITKECNELPFYSRLYRDDGSIIVLAKINGLESLFLLDTGAGASFVTPKFAKRLGQKVNNSNLKSTITASGNENYYEGFHGVLEIGSCRTLDFHFYIKEKYSDKSSLVRIEYSGYIGMDWMQNRRFLFVNDFQELYFN